MHARPILILAVRGLALATLAGLAACGSMPSGKREHACMTRVMYFESNRSSAEGMLAVGTVVMNRVESDKFPNTVCEVVGQKNQFAPGVMTKPMKEGKSLALASKVATDVLKGKRHRGVGKAMFFHTAGYNFSYNNMHYMVIAGGNAFYDKRSAPPGGRNRTQIEVAQAARRRPERPVDIARIEPPPEHLAEPVQVASATPPEPPRIPVPPPLDLAPPPAPALATDPLLAAVPIGEPASIEDLIMLSGG